MSTQHCNTIRNMAAALRHLNRATGRRYRIRRDGDSYILISPLGGEYSALPAHETVVRLVTLRIAAQGRT